MTGFNLIPLPRRQAQRVRTEIRRWISIAIAYIVLVACALAAAGAAWDTDHSALDHRLADLQRHQTNLQDSLKKLKERIDADQRKLAADKAVSLQPDWSVLLALLPGSLGDDAALSSLSLRQDPPPPPAAGPAAKPEPQSSPPRPAKPVKPPPERGYTLKLAGVARSQASPSAIVVSLEESRLFDRVKLVETRRETAGKSDLIIFEIECRLAAGSSAGAEKKE